MQSIKYNYRETIPFDDYNSSKYVFKGIQKLSKKDFWDPLIGYIFDPNNIRIVLIKDNQYIQLTNTRQVLTIFLTEQGTLLQLISGYIQDYVKKNNFQYLHMSIPSEREFYFEKVKLKPVDSQIQYQINQTLYDKLKIAFNKDQLVFETDHAGNKVQVELLPKPPIQITDLYLQILQNSKKTNIELVDKEVQYGSGMFQSDEIILDNIQKAVETQNIYSFPLIRQHLKKINPSNIYYIFPNLSLNVVPPKNINLFNISNIPNKMRLLFCMYQAYRVFMPQNPVFGGKEQDSLDLSKIQVTMNLQDINHISVVLNAIASKYRPTTPVYDLMIHLDFDTLGRLNQNQIDNFGFLVFVDENIQYQYIEKQPDGKWYSSRKQIIIDLSKQQLDRLLENGVFLRTF